MGCAYFAATETDLEALAWMRMEFVKDMYPEYAPSLLEDIQGASLQYFQEQYALRQYVGFFGMTSGGPATIASDAFTRPAVPSGGPGEVIACSGGLLVYLLPPLHGTAPRKVGHVLNFYTRPAFRQRGYGCGLMSYMQEYARENGFDRLFLNATEAGAPLYRKIGFRQVEDAMVHSLLP